ncbi:hypothetical protein [uncultured Mediterranean phage uvMED]|nr:hypothetical protein [uncultured Mediterranean phage uvMED]BAR22583.1 hypothetical protein [uncultured Mediterranean phage uvMED]
MSIYTLDFEKFIKNYLPPDKRGAVNVATLKAFLSPLDALHSDTFGTFGDEVKAKAKHTSQKIYFEKVLNEAFADEIAATGSGPIYINNKGKENNPVTFFNESEGLEPVYFFNGIEGEDDVYFFNESEISDNRIFEVYIDANTTPIAEENNPKLRAELDRLKPAGTSYTIIEY